YFTAKCSPMKQKPGFVCEGWHAFARPAGKLGQEAPPSGGRTWPWGPALWRAGLAMGPRALAGGPGHGAPRSGGRAWPWGPALWRAGLAMRPRALAGVLATWLRGPAF